ncbi:MAG: transcriptional regulator/antitoxin, MazE [Pseudanabaena sp.]
MVGDELEIVGTKEQLVKPVRKIRSKYHLQGLVAQIPHDYKAQEEDWGASVSLETW